MESKDLNLYKERPEEIVAKLCDEIYSLNPDKNMLKANEEISNFSLNNDYENNLILLLSFANNIPKKIELLKDKVKENFRLENAVEEKEITLDDFIKGIIKQLTTIYTKLNDTSKLLHSIFKRPLDLLEQKTKERFDLYLIHKEEFFYDIYEDNDIIKVISEIKDGMHCRKTNEFFTQFKTALKSPKREINRFKKLIESELSKIHLQKEKEKIEKEVDIDELVRLINEGNTKKKSKKKKAKKNNKEESLKSSLNSNSTNQNSINIENEKGEGTELLIEEVKSKLKSDSVCINEISKINPCFSEKWLSSLKGE